MFLKVVQSRQFCIQILEMARCNARTHFSHPPPHFYKWGDCPRVYDFKSSSVQTVLQPNIKMKRCNARTHFSHSSPRFYEWGGGLRVYFFKISAVQTVPHVNLQDGTLQCENTFIVACAWLFTLGTLGRILPPRLCKMNTAQLNEAVHE